MLRRAAVQRLRQACLLVLSSKLSTSHRRWQRRWSGCPTGCSTTFWRWTRSCRPLYQIASSDHYLNRQDNYGDQHEVLCQYLRIEDQLIGDIGDLDASVRFALPQ